MEQKINLINNTNKLQLQIIEKYLSVYDLKSNDTHINAQLPMVKQCTIDFLNKEKNFQYCLSPFGCCSFIQFMSHNINYVPNLSNELKDGRKRVSISFIDNESSSDNSIMFQSLYFMEASKNAIDKDVFKTIVDDNLFEEFIELYKKGVFVLNRDIYSRTNTINFSEKQIPSDCDYRVNFKFEAKASGVKDKEYFSKILEYWEKKFSDTFPFHYSIDKDFYTISIDCPRKISNRKFLLATIEIARVPFSVESIYSLGSYMLENDFGFKFEKVFTSYMLLKNLFYVHSPSILTNLHSSFTNSNAFIPYSFIVPEEKYKIPFYDKLSIAEHQNDAINPLQYLIFDVTKREKYIENMLRKYEITAYDSLLVNRFIPYILFDILMKDNSLFNKLFDE